MAQLNHAPKGGLGKATFRREVWESFSTDRELRALHQITDQEMEALSRLATLGSILSKQDYIFILNTIRKPPKR
ncbi:MAG TPA: hypothetical protein VNF29_04395 [Candidatus Binataceae bacterium]|nr:hypothetical protein [Candidatus Binataceae bacterium]